MSVDDALFDNGYQDLYPWQRVTLMWWGWIHSDRALYWYEGLEMGKHSQAAFKDAKKMEV